MLSGALWKLLLHCERTTKHKVNRVSCCQRLWCTRLQYKPLPCHQSLWRVSIITSCGGLEAGIRQVVGQNMKVTYWQVCDYLALRWAVRQVPERNRGASMQMCAGKGKDGRVVVPTAPRSKGWQACILIIFSPLLSACSLWIQAAMVSGIQPPLYHFTFPPENWLSLSCGVPVGRGRRTLEVGDVHCFFIFKIKNISQIGFPSEAITAGTFSDQGGQ